MSRKTLKYILNLALVVVFAGGAMAFLLRDSDLGEVWRQIQESDQRYLIGGCLLMASYVCSESVILRYLLGYLGQKIKLGSCILLSNVSFFYCALTPGASGGQPMQIYYMTKNGIDTLVGTLSAMVVTVLFKFALLLLLLIFIILEPAMMLSSIGEVWFLFTIGMVCTVVFLAFLIICIFKPEIADMLVAWLISLGGKLKLIKKPERLLGKAMRSLRQYEEASGFIKNNKKLMITPMLITLFQRLCYFSVPFMVLKALHVDYSWTAIVGIQLVLSMSVDVLPIPGASGATESVFVMLFTSIVGSELVMPAMLLHRGITYYLLVIVGGVVALFAQIYFVKKGAKLEKLKQKASIHLKRRRLHLASCYIRPEEAPDSWTSESEKTHKRHRHRSLKKLMHKHKEKKKAND